MKSTDILTFSKLFILEDGNPIQIEDWQHDNILKPVFYDLDDNGIRRYNLSLSGMPKKNGKSTLSSLVAAYMLLADGENEPEVYGCAGSRDQAKIIFGQTKKAIERSPILSNEVNVYRDVLERKDGKGFYRVLSSDAPRQHGLNPHCTIFDELWNQENYDLFEAMTTSPARKQPITFVVTYSGYRPWEGDLLFDLYSTGKAGTDPGMHFFWTNDNNASWITKKYLDQQRRRLPEHIFRRLHLNEWTTGSGSFLNQGDVTAATDPALAQVFKGQDGNLYHMALDLGLRRDRTAIAVVHKSDSGLTILDHMKLFEAPKGGELLIEDVESYISELIRVFNFGSISFDPWQSIRTRQFFEAKGLNITEFIFSGNNWVALTKNLLSLFKDRRIKIYEQTDLIQELLSVKIVERSYGYRIDHKAGYHDDCVVALAMVALAAQKQAQGLFAGFDLS